MLVELDRFDYDYLWTWLGVPIIQLPADVMATQEVIWATRPDVIVETGVARGGSMIFLASMLQLIGHGRVIGVDIDIRAHNRETITQHPLSRRVELVEGGSTDPDTLARVKAAIPDGAKVMVILNSPQPRSRAGRTQGLRPARFGWAIPSRRRYGAWLYERRANADPAFQNMAGRR